MAAYLERVVWRACVERGRQADEQRGTGAKGEGKVPPGKQIESCGSRSGWQALRVCSRALESSGRIYSNKQYFLYLISRGSTSRICYHDPILLRRRLLHRLSVAGSCGATVCTGPHLAWISGLAEPPMRPLHCVVAGPCVR